MDYNQRLKIYVLLWLENLKIFARKSLKFSVQKFSTATILMRNTLKQTDNGRPVQLGRATYPAQKWHNFLPIHSRLVVQVL